MEREVAAEADEAAALEGAREDRSVGMAGATRKRETDVGLAGTRSLAVQHPRVRGLVLDRLRCRGLGVVSRDGLGDSEHSHQGEKPGGESCYQSRVET